MQAYRRPQISPSILSADFSCLGTEIASIERAGGSLLHLDIMDGHYVPNLSFGPLVVKAVRQMTNLLLEAHLMITDPDQYLPAYIAAGADLVLIHPATCADPAVTLEHIHQLGAQAGLVVNPDENLNLVIPYLNTVDQLLIMSVYPGFGGQQFIPEVLAGLPDLLPELRKHGVLVEIDGGINRQTLPTLAEQGIDRFVVGSAIFNTSATPAEHYQILQKLIDQK